MPIFEFECKNCNHQFEELVFHSDESLPTCPECKSGNAEKLISAGCIRPNGIPSGAGGFKPPACSGASRSGGG